jgi:hypothetical protein
MSLLARFPVVITENSAHARPDSLRGWGPAAGHVRWCGRFREDSGELLFVTCEDGSVPTSGSITFRSENHAGCEA